MMDESDEFRFRMRENSGCSCSRSRRRSIGCLRITEFQSTPNPNALKCVVEGTVPPATTRPGRPRSYTTIETADQDSFAKALLEVEGVTNVLITDTWFTVSKDSAAEWKAIKTALERVVAKM